MPDGGGLEKIALPLAAAVATPFIGPELIPAALADTAGAVTVADALTGAALGAGASALTGGNPLIGAVTGGVGGGLAPNLGDIANAVGLGGDASGAAAAVPAATTPAAPDVTLGGGVTSTAPVAGAGTTAALTPTSAVAAGPSAAAPLGGAAGAGGAPIDLTSLGDVTTGGGLNLTPTAGGAGAAPSLPGLTAGGGASDLLTTPANLTTAGSPGLLNTSGASLANPSASLADLSAPAGGAGAGGGGVLDKLTSAVTKNPLGALIGGGGLAYNMISQPKLPSAAQPAAVAPQVAAEAGQLQTQGAQLQNYLTSGTLPPGAQQSLTTAANNAKTAIKSKYASLGLSGSTMEQQDLNNIDLQVQQEGFNMAAQLLQQGVSETGLSAQIYDQLLGISNQQNQATGSAIANFAQALNGGPNVTIKAGG